MASEFVIITLIVAIASIEAQVPQQQTQGIYLGSLPNLSHGVSGEVYKLDDKTLLLRNLNYDGQAPDAYFWVGTSAKPGVTGSPIPDENGSLAPLKRYHNVDIVLRLPANKSLSKLKTFGLWCKAYSINFGHVKLN
ncbi:Skeletor-like protein [Sarcoptes scabiei]|uniref:Skeletor-like protein n=1 Tax=Sarcoptes scabiei TaxID=52283 RepID=A0A132AA64_SARSC|nr:Skeletor-like protein [Sarcoptes scabiei]